MSETIIRMKRKKDRNFTMLENAEIRKRELTWKATGIYCYLCSLPDGKPILLKDLKHRKADGRDSTAQGMKELIAHGYLYRYQKRLKNGKMGPWVTEFYECPEDNPHFTPQTENPNSDSSISENPNLIYLNTVFNKDLKELNDINLLTESDDSALVSIEGRIRQLIDEQKIKDIYMLTPAAVEVLNHSQVATEVFNLLLAKKNYMNMRWDSALKVLIGCVKHLGRFPTEDEIAWVEQKRGGNDKTRFIPKTLYGAMQKAVEQGVTTLDDRIMPFINDTHHAYLKRRSNQLQLPQIPADNPYKKSFGSIFNKGGNKA